MPGLGIVNRAQWGAEPYRGTPTAQPRYDAIVVHHSAGFLSVRQIQRLHQVERGWSDIGYHFLIDEAGTVFQGRPAVGGQLAIGAHVGGANTGKVGVCLMGCFHPEMPDCDDSPRPSMIDALGDLLAYLCRTYGIAAGEIFGHRDFKATACPGSEVYARLDEVRSSVLRLVCRELVAELPDGALGEAEEALGDLAEQHRAIEALAEAG